MTKLALTSATTGATTYHFQTTGDEWRSWALCTVNDATGELLITSDWDNWSYRWNASPEALGHPTLTAFIGERDSVDYIARKLQGKRGQRFSAAGTVSELRKLLCEARLEDGRRRKPRLSRERAREIWEAIGDVAEDAGNNESIFIDRVCQIVGIDLLTEAPYEYIATVQTPEDKALRELILPALIAACTETHKARQ